MMVEVDKVLVANRCDRQPVWPSSRSMEILARLWLIVLTLVAILIPIAGVMGWL
jgi:hypothetical protein